MGSVARNIYKISQTLQIIPNTRTFWFNKFRGSLGKWCDIFLTKNICFKKCVRLESGGCLLWLMLGTIRLNNHLVL